MKTAERVLEYKQTFERANVPLREILIEGRKIRLIFDKAEESATTGLNKTWSDK